MKNNMKVIHEDLKADRLFLKGFSSVDNKYKRLFSLFLSVLFFSAFFIGCSKDKDEGGGGGDLGTVTLTAKGDVNGTFKGMADFEGVALSSRADSWDLSMHDYDPQTFSLNIGRMYDGLEVPERGTYSIGSPLDADYTVIFTDTRSQTAGYSYKEYTIFGSEPHGTLTITSSSEKTVKGKLAVTVYYYDDDGMAVDEVELNGEFTANKRIR